MPCLNEAFSFSFVVVGIMITGRSDAGDTDTTRINFLDLTSLHYSIACLHGQFDCIASELTMLDMYFGRGTKPYL
jgi:hypothetical protein